MHTHFTDDAIASLERATLDAVAPVEQEQFDAWILPFDKSTIGRATSAVPLRHHNIDPSTLEQIEARYTVRGLQAAFRIADVPNLAPLTERLSHMGYSATQPTLVQIGDIKTLLALESAEQILIERSASDTWASVYTAEGFDPVDGAHRVQALSRSQCVVYATINRGDQAIAAGTASMSQGWIGIHGMRTVISARGKGLATGILQGLARSAAQNSYERVYLQVEANNSPALALYRRAGFQTAWRYHYWRKATI